MAENYATWASRWRVTLGFGLGVAYFILARPAFAPLICGGLLALSGLLLRAWAAGHLAKNQRLAASGPYACTRNPLYLGSAMMGVGAAVAGRSWILALAFVAFFALVYWPVMQREARFLEGEFPQAYESYARQVPLFFPRIPRHSSASEKFQGALYLRNREYNAALGFVGAMLFLVLRMWLR